MSDDGTVISIALPLPVGVTSAVMQAIGTMWPTSTIDTRGSTTGPWDRAALRIRIPDRLPRPLTKKAAAAIVDDTTPDEEAPELDMLGFTPDGHLQITAPEEMALRLGQFLWTLLEAHPTAHNYLEFVLHHPEAPLPLVVTAVRSEGQTPGALRSATLASIRSLTAAYRAEHAPEDGTPVATLLDDLDDITAPPEDTP